MMVMQYISCVGQAYTNSSSQEDPKEMCWYAHYIFGNGNSMALFRLQANQIFSGRLSALLIPSDQIRFVCPNITNLSAWMGCFGNDVVSLSNCAELV